MLEDILKVIFFCCFVGIPTIAGTLWYVFSLRSVRCFFLKRKRRKERAEKIKEFGEIFSLNPCLEYSIQDDVEKILTRLANSFFFAARIQQEIATIRKSLKTQGYSDEYISKKIRNESIVPTFFPSISQQMPLVELEKSFDVRVKQRKDFFREAQKIAKLFGFKLRSEKIGDYQTSFYDFSIIK